MSETDVLKMKVADLKRELKLRGLSGNGNKNELQERLQSALLDGDLSLEDSAIAMSAEALLDDDVLTDEEEKGALDLSHDDPETISTSSKTEEKPITTAAITATSIVDATQKKVILKRNISHIIVPSPDPIIPTTAVVSESSDITDLPPEKKIKLDETIVEKKDAITTENASGETKKVIKLSELTMKDRLEMRAKKFGVPPSSDAAKLARAERFQSGSETSKLSANGSSAPTVISLDKLKKRAERFGGSVSSRMTDIEKKEKLLKRQERFGSGGSGKTDSSVTVLTVANKTTEANGGANGTTNADYAEKAKQRLERFKTAVK